MMKDKKYQKKIWAKAPDIFLILLLLFLITLQEEQIFGYKYFEPDSDRNNVIEVSIEDAKELFSKTDKIENVGSEINVYNSQNELIGILLNSTPYSNNIIGYASSVPVLIGLSVDEKIVGSKLLKNFESPEYVDHIKKSSLLTTWDSKNILDAVSHKVDAISGATETSEAIIKSVHARLSIYKKLYTTEDNTFNFLNIGLLTSISLLCFALLSVFLPKYFRKYRLILLVANMLVWGVWQGFFISVFLLKSWMVLGVSVSHKLLLFIIVVLAFIFPIFTNKRVYCYYVCPFGAAQELVSKSKIKKMKLSKQTVLVLSGLGYLILLTILLLLITGIPFDLSLVEPFSIFNYKSVSILTIFVASIIIAFSIVIDRPWCRYLCPTGKLLSLFQNKK